MRRDLLCLITASAGCGGPLAGGWAGTWTSQAGASRPLEAHLSTDAEDRVTGTFTFVDNPCFSATDVVGALVGDHLAVSATAGAIRLDLDATLVDDALNGAWFALAAGTCTGDSGTFSLQR